MTKNNSLRMLASLKCAVAALIVLTSLPLLATTLTFAPGAQLNLAVSATNPNMIVVPGDRIINISSASGMLTDKKNTKNGAVFFSTASQTPFTFFVETELGQLFSVNATPKNGEGRTYRLQPTTATPRPIAKAWESAQPYESMLVSLNRALLQSKLPDGYGPATISGIAPLAVQGLYATPESAWTGHSLNVVRYKLSNRLSIPVTLREQDFWQPGIRAVLVYPRYNRLLAGASTYLYLTRTGEAPDAKH